ncbi:MAG: DUF2066 domain-containing protein [Pseudomonadota bacterium]
MARLLFVVFALFCGQATASDRVFTVPEVSVFAEAKSSSQAQRQARDAGRALAFDTLLRRLVAEEDWIYLPRMAEDQPAPASAQAFGQGLNTGGVGEESFETFSKTPISLDRRALRSFEQETNVFNEKSSGTTYRASITYRFKPDAVRQLLQQARLPYSEQQARETMVLPVLQTENGTYLWEAKNPWARAWLAEPLAHELTPMILPRGDVLDVQAVTAMEARNLNAAQLRAFSERYQSPRMMLALGELTEVGNLYRFRVRLIEATPPALDDGAETGLGTMVADVTFQGGQDDFPALARTAVEGAVQQLSNRWKRRTLVDYSTQRRFELTAWFSDTRGWAQISEAIDDSALVVDRRDGAFNNNGTKIVLTVVGEERQFRLAMAQKNLAVWMDTDGVWHIAEADRAADLKMIYIPASPEDIIRTEQDNQRRGLGRLFRRDRGGSDGDVPELPEDLFGDDSGQN